MNTSENNSEESEKDKPPILKSWRNMYIAVLANLVLLIILFYFFKQYFS